MVLFPVRRGRRAVSFLRTIAFSPVTFVLMMAILV